MAERITVQRWPGCYFLSEQKLAERISREQDLDKLLLYGKKAARAESVEQFMEEMGA